MAIVGHTTQWALPAAAPQLTFLERDSLTRKFIKVIRRVLSTRATRASRCHRRNGSEITGSNVTIHTPDRSPGEAPIRPDQLEAIKSISNDFDLSKVSEFGEVQVESLLNQLKQQQKEASKTLLKKFYAYHGHAVPDDFIDRWYDNPKEHITVIYDRSEKGGCLSIIGYFCLL